MMFIGGGVGGAGRIGGGGRRPAPGTPDFSLSNSSATTAWGTVSIGDLAPINAPAGVTFRLVDEPAGLAVVNG
ncbi:hypothetical protein [Sandarakinorhabdus sp.]|uniref:hypothetical protein n=1 Tax=Sandarakinorhabdus sp. TaxID=1916663 RepID=UPI00334126CD